MSSLEHVFSEGHSKKLCEHFTQVGNGAIFTVIAGIMLQLKCPYRNGQNFVHSSRIFTPYLIHRFLMFSSFFTVT